MAIYQTDGGTKCDGCGKAFGYDDLYSRFEGADYATYFDLECECGAVIEIEVASIPEFSKVLTRPAPPEVPDDDASPA